MIKNIEHFKRLLKLEHQKVKRILDSLGSVHTDNKNDYDAVVEPLDTETSEIEEIASRVENFETRFALEAEMEKRFNEINAALLAIEDGSYGKCIYCKAKITEARLEANPAALTCLSCADKNPISSTL